MSNSPKVKVYKNPSRNAQETHKPYVPQYQLMGVEPAEYKSPLAPGYPVAMTKTPLDTNNTRAARPVIRQPYAEAVESPIGKGRGLLPNVGNNIEQTWSGVDNVIDDLTIDPNQPMVDNNEFVTTEALGLPEGRMEIGGEAINSLREAVSNVEKSILTEDTLKDVLTQEYFQAVISKMEEDEYLLLVNGETICSGPEDYIQKQTTALVFGEHELYDGNPVSPDDIIVIKRIPIRVGVFLK